jgi:methyltransferase family protein
MPDLRQNYQAWNELYRWEQQGEEWSHAWGGSEAQWYFAIYPRIHSFLPAGHLLEIAPGYGRWTQYLRNYCTRLSLVDLSEKCIEVCRQRFQDVPFIECHVNDGLSLGMIHDDSCDFIFTFDSLVHAEIEVLESYVREISSKLTSQGIAFIHHSNLSSVPELARTAPGAASHWRAPSVSSELVRKAAEANGLICLSQEAINWGTKECIDCITVLARPCSRYERPCIFFENPYFMTEAEAIKRCSQVYTFQPGTRSLNE